MQANKVIGSVFLIMGSILGGGVLALPLITAGADLFSTICAMTFMWILQFITGLLFLEVNLAFPSPQTNFSSMAFKTIGNFGKSLTALSYLFLLFALIAAYVAAGGSLLHEVLQLTPFHLPKAISSLLFVLILGGVVFKGTKAVDYVNRCFFSFKGLLLVLVIALALPKIEWSNLVLIGQSSKYLWAALPILLCAFGFHILIPIVSSYLNYEKKQILVALFLGSFFSWILYILWITITKGIVPLTGFLELAKQNGSVGEFVFLFSCLLKNKWMESFLHIFVNITVTTCFLGIGLGLFNFLEDLLKRPKNLSGKWQITFCTFVPPTLFALFYPQGFIFALGFAAFSVAFSHVMLPAWMVFQLRKKQIPSPYRVKGGNFFLATIFLIGTSIIILQLLVNFNVLPILGK